MLLEALVTAILDANLVFGVLGQREPLGSEARHAVTFIVKVSAGGGV